PGVQFSLLRRLLTHTLNHLDPAIQQPLSLPLPNRQQLHGCRHKTRCRLIEKRSNGVFLRPTCCRQCEPKADSHVSWCPIRFNSSQVIIDQSVTIAMLHCHTNHLPSHLSAGGPSFAPQLHFVQFSIDCQRHIEDTGDERIMCQSNHNGFPFPHSGCERLNHETRQFLRIPNHTSLHRRLKSRREGIASRRKEAIDESKTG